jgi:tetratricopeptide (TPR) repeat protein
MKKIYPLIFTLSLIGFICSPAWGQSARQHLEAGNGNFRAKNYPAAIQEFSRALALSPGLVEAYNNRGLSQAGLQDYRQAIRDYDQALKLAPRQADAWYNRGLAKAGLKDYAGAIADYTQAISYRPGFAPAYYNRALAQGLLGNYSVAMADLTQVTTLEPRDAAAWYLLGNAQFNARNQKSCCASWQKASALGHAQARLMLRQHCR